MSLFPQNLNDFVASMGIPRGPSSKAFIVDPVNGSDSNPGTNWLSPLKTLEAAYALTTADKHDAVLFLSGDTADNPAAAVTWGKDYTHLIGLGPELEGVGQRSRIVGTAALDLAQVITFSSNGCIVKNVQIYNGADANADKGAAIVSGSRNYFENVFFAGMAHATPAARAGSYSLKVSGSENLFKRCSVGLDTIVRAAANAELRLESGATRNTFRKCRFLSYSETAGKFLVMVNEGVDRWTEFEDCVFQNFSVNWAVSLTDAFNMNAASTHQIVLRGMNQLVGVTGWADTVTRIYSVQPQSNAGFGVVVNPTT